MQEVIDRLREADSLLCDQMNALCGQGETVFTSPLLCKLSEARQNLWRVRNLLREEEEEPCEKS